MSRDVERRKTEQALFRRKATQAVGYRLFSGVTIAMPPSATVGLIVSFWVVAALIAAVVVVEVPLRSRAVGVLVPSGGLVDVVASQSGRVEGVYVVAGEVVPDDRLLLRITSGDGSTQGQPAAKMHLQSLRSELHLLEKVYLHEKQLATDRWQALQEDLQAADLQLRLGENVLATYAEQLQLREVQFERSRALANDGHIARDEYDRQVAALLSSRAGKTETELRVVEFEQNLVMLKRSTGELRELEAQQAVRHAIEVERLQREIVAADYSFSGEYRASENARIAHLLVVPGAVVKAGQVLAKLRRIESTLEVWLYVSTSQARMLQPGQPVEIRLDAYPQAVFGTFSATVLSVSGVALLPTEIDVPLMIPGPVFEVRAALDDDQIEYANANWSLQPGISFQADIVQQRLRLYEWLLRSVTRQSNRRA